jgi:hypothetical protein
VGRGGGDRALELYTPSRARDRWKVLVIWDDGSMICWWMDTSSGALPSVLAAFGTLSGGSVTGGFRCSRITRPVFHVSMTLANGKSYSPEVVPIFCSLCLPLLLAHLFLARLFSCYSPDSQQTRGEVESFKAESGRQERERIKARQGKKAGIFDG